MRIAFDARYISDRYHGIGRYSFRLLEALVTAAPEYQFILFRGREKDSRFNWENIAALPNVRFQAGPWPLYWPQEQLLWPWYLRGMGADLFHTPYFVVPLLSSTPMIHTVHDLIFDRYPAYMPWAWSRPYYRLLMYWGTRRARRTVAVSEFTASDLTRYYGTTADKVVVIGEGVDPTFAPVTDAEQLEGLRRRYHLLGPFVLSVGARRPHKNQARLVRAFSCLSAQISHDLVLVGPTDDRFLDEARRTVQGKGLNGRVKFLNWVPEEHLSGLYSLADLVVLPSLMEGFGLPALEAMACGTPVVVADNSSLPEVVGEAAALVDPYDVAQLAGTIRQMLDDGLKRRRLADAGRRRAATFTWAKVAEQMLKVYQEVTRK